MRNNMRLLTLILVLAPLWSAAQLSINGNIKGLPEGSVLTLHANDAASAPLATATAKAGKFSLSAANTEPNIYVLQYAAAGKRMVMFLENTPVSIEGSADAFDKLVVKGSAANQDFQIFGTEFSPLYQKLSAAAQEINNGKQERLFRNYYLWIECLR
ncbi:MAG: DUF4369 domain-containing protein [Sphingobacteriales bacterium]|nr:MAG: DUF4369 domain-containing protein [Sphingobacteriales bacterium]